MKKYPIAERFTSLQGEGLFTGTLMHFVRFAGCSVGKPNRTMANLNVSPTDELKVYREICTTYDGREFLCDTDFRTKEVLSVDEIIAGIPSNVGRVCLTGGEPLDQPLTPLMRQLCDDDFLVHIETSGTKEIQSAYSEFHEADTGPEDDGGWVWITVSPKSGCLESMVTKANEIKLLVDEKFDVEKIPLLVRGHDLVWVQPVNEEFSIYDPNVRRCLDLVNRFPNFRLSMQMHKIWKVR